jgi:hypothetical protein
MEFSAENSLVLVGLLAAAAGLLAVADVVRVPSRSCSCSEALGSDSCQEA